MIREQIQQSDEYQTITARQEAQASGPRDAKTVGDALAPVTSLEKGDVEFWLMVAQLVVLLLILRELRRQGGAV